ncbi:NAD(P)-binding protein [Ferrovibrio sp.]|uniref:NAD(P)-binding protein n=1 Tax=Ferrovibrio sp. TaxID=1917215 RepID=UPI000CC55DF3|nr:NAD(P)-binding protein [Ferrovibrio sp.]PJI37905.1 MAG: flavoprotein [Ferrovibrio sp.]
MTALTKIIRTSLPVVVIGAGPVGLAAAAHLVVRNIPVKLLEAGSEVGAHVRDWGHVQLFSPWSYNIDKAARALLDRNGWQAPKRSLHPTGAELYEQYLKPLAATPEIAAVLECDARVTGVSRLGFDKMKSAGRDHAPFSVIVQHKDGRERQELASAVIDTSGTWTQHNPIGGNGLPVPGETAARDAIAYGVPDVLGRDAAHYAGKRILVIGAGHSAANVLLDLAKLKDSAPATEIVWAVRGASLARLFGGGANDKLAARGALGQALETLVKAGGIDLHMHSTVTCIEVSAALGVTLATPGGADQTLEVDRIIAATGQRPDLAMLREIRLDLDPATESPRVLAPMIDPNMHSCGTVRPHGHRELAQPDSGFYIAGIKSYGRAPTFLLATGYEQVRSIVAALAGDMMAADDIQLDLPETGVCSTNLPKVTGVEGDGERCGTSCCGTPEPVPAATACCTRANETAVKAGQQARPVAATACC